MVHGSLGLGLENKINIFGMQIYAYTTHTHRGFWELWRSTVQSLFTPSKDRGRRPGKARGACDDPQLPFGALGRAQAQQPRGRLREEDQLASLASVAVVLSGLRAGVSKNYSNYP